MKKIKFLVTGLIGLAASALYGQNQQNRWLIGVGAHAVDHSAVHPVFNKFLKTKNWSVAPPLSKLTVARSLTNHLAVDLAASMGEIDNHRAGWDRFKNELFLKAGLGLRFYPFAKNCWVDPYLKVGANFHRLDYKGKTYTISPSNTFTTDKKNFFLVDGGVGINFWITENFGLNLESNYNWVPSVRKDYANFFQHSAGVSYRFGKKDRDKDGISDDEDQCLNIPGLKQFKGCPDTDGDGVPQHKDKCPNIAGPKENNGCPYKDTDRDGVPDKNDACPKVPGLKQFKGCPDTDGDRVLDKDDACPKVPGLKRFKGCPDTDGDGVSDNLDKCPKVPGPKENGGCLWDIKKEIIEINLSFKDILFDFGKAKIRDEASREVIKEAAKRMNQRVPNSRFYVDGNTDNVGKPAFNKQLSLKRANAVKNLLIENGVSKDRLISRGFGQEQPKVVNKTTEDRQTNRRVEIVIRNVDESLEIESKGKIKKKHISKNKPSKYRNK
ncbi:MAG: OmpA family protein [Flavobacteriales bacterium Tduv]